MTLCVDWLQLLQRGFTTSNTLYEQNIFIWISRPQQEKTKHLQFLAQKIWYYKQNHVHMDNA